MHGAVKRGDLSALALHRLSAVGIIWEGSVSAHILLRNPQQNIIDAIEDIGQML